MPEGIKPDERKLAAVRDFPVPSNVKQLKAFLGLAGYYRKFVLRFSPVAKPLHKLTGKNVPYVWGEEQESAFRTLKDILCNEPLLQYLDFEKEFILNTTARALLYPSWLTEMLIRLDASALASILHNHWFVSTPLLELAP
jgi:hypothetical protein